MHRTNLLILAGFFAMVGFMVLSQPTESSAARRLLGGSHGCCGATVACCGDTVCSGVCTGCSGRGRLLGGRSRCSGSCTGCTGSCHGVSRCSGCSGCSGKACSGCSGRTCRGGGLLSRLRSRCCGDPCCGPVVETCCGCAGSVTHAEGGEGAADEGSAELAPVPDGE